MFELAVYATGMVVCFVLIVRHGETLLGLPMQDTADYVMLAMLAGLTMWLWPFVLLCMALTFLARRIHTPASKHHPQRSEWHETRQDGMIVRWKDDD